MGAPKQKWLAEEEVALKAGVLKHGVGRWRTIVKDPEFSGVLQMRSNVDLKDKWRNMSLMANGWGSRDRAKLTLKRTHQDSKHKENPIAIISTVQSDEEFVDSKALVVASGPSQMGGSRRSMMRLDNLIMEAINYLKEPGGSNKTSISTYIEEQYWAPPNFKRLLSAKLKVLTANRKLIKMKRKYTITPTALPERRNLSLLFLDGRHRASPKIDRDDVNGFTKCQIELDLGKMKNMNPEEAAAAAAWAVADAEAAIAEAEEAEREAEAAEADAEAAQAFAEAEMKTLEGKVSLG